MIQGTTAVGGCVQSELQSWVNNIDVSSSVQVEGHKVQRATLFSCSEKDLIAIDAMEQAEQMYEKNKGYLELREKYSNEIIGNYNLGQDLRQTMTDKYAEARTANNTEISKARYNFYRLFGVTENSNKKMFK